MFHKLIPIFLLLTQACYAQHGQKSINPASGIIIYKQRINISSLDIQKDTLRFNRSASIFHWNTARYIGKPGLKAFNKKFPNSKSGGSIKGSPSFIYYGDRINLYNTKKDSIYSLMGMKYISKLLYLKEKTPQINWAIQDSTKKIGNYEVKKATTTFRGHYYTAWFTPKIPVPYGPWKLHGLPGLILQAYDKSGNIYFSSTNITLGAIKSIDSIALNGSEQTITLGKYKEILGHYKQYQKHHLMKITRQIKGISKEDLANMQYHLQDVNHMEIFSDSIGQ